MQIAGRTKPHPILCPALALLAVACERAPAPEADRAAAEAAPAIGVMLDTEQQSKLGIEVAPLAAAELEERVEGPALVMDAQTVIQRMSDLSAAEAADRQSRAALDRAKKLFEADASVSREVLERAQSQAAADRARLDVARTQAAVAFGYGAPWLDPKRRTARLDALTAGEAVVVRASFPGGLPKGIPNELALRRIGERASQADWKSADVWLGPADPGVPGPVLFAYVEAAPRVVSGERLVASVGTGLKLAGTLVPGSAVVIAGGAAWCYVRRDEESFVREAVSLDHPLGDGYFQQAEPAPAKPRSKDEAGLTAGLPTVTAGAGLLLARETGGGEEED